MSVPDAYAPLMPAIRRSRASWQRRRPPVTPEPLGDGDESVWDYPRPPKLEPVAKEVLVEHGGITIARSATALRILETAGAPTIYIPRDDVRMDLLRDNGHESLCEWKGYARYFDLVLPGERPVRDVAWTVPQPLDDLGMGYERIRGWVSFYPGRVDACRLGGERVSPQPGGFYGGWVTSRIKGPIKGVPGSSGW